MSTDLTPVQSLTEFTYPAMRAHKIMPTLFNVWYYLSHVK